jgi:3-hydroxyisobutyrate dehydrogenase
MSEISVLGLGNMGLPIARNLLNVKFDLTIWNRTASRGADLPADGARIAATPAEAIRDSDIA